MIDLNVPRRAYYLHNAWKKHQDAVYWVDINLALKKGLMFYQTRSNAIILQETLPAYCIPKVVRLKTGEVTSTVAKDLIEARMEKRIGFGSCSTTRRVSCSTTSRRSCSTSIFFQPTEPTPDPIRDRSGRHDNMQDVIRKNVPFPGDQC